MLRAQLLSVRWSGRRDLQSSGSHLVRMMRCGVTAHMHTHAAGPNWRPYFLWPKKTVTAYVPAIDAKKEYAKDKLPGKCIL